MKWVLILSILSLAVNLSMSASFYFGDMQDQPQVYPDGELPSQNKGFATFFQQLQNKLNTMANPRTTGSNDEELDRFGFSLMPRLGEKGESTITKVEAPSGVQTPLSPAYKYWRALVNMGSLLTHLKAWDNTREKKPISPTKRNWIPKLPKRYTHCSPSLGCINVGVSLTSPEQSAGAKIRYG